ncbi:MAG: phage major capsid protein, partial [Pseudomonadota bacterium]
MNSLELRRLARAKLDEAGELGKTADAASEETQAKITALMAESDRLNGAAANAEEIEKRKMATAPAPAEHVSIGAPRFEQDPSRGFENQLDFVLSVLNAGRSRKGVDERLKSLTAGSDEAGAYDDASGGYLIPVTFIPRLLQTPWEGDPTAGLTTNIPMATPRVNIPA